MANKVALVHASIWADPDFVTRSASAQRLYVLLISQDDINLCGALALRPNRWAALAPDTKAPAITKALRELERARFIVTDTATDELLVRTYPRHAGTLKQPNVIVGMSKQYALVRSAHLRRVIVEELPATALDVVRGPVRAHLAEPFLTDFTLAKQNGSGNPSPDPFPKRSANGTPNVSAEPSLYRLTAGPLPDEVDQEGSSQVFPPDGSAPASEPTGIAWLRSVS